MKSSRFFIFTFTHLFIYDMCGYFDNGSFFTLYLSLFFPVGIHYNKNADLSDGEDDELLLLDTEVGTDDDQENQADAVASTATTTTAANVEEDRPEFEPHCKLSRGEDLFEFRKVEMVKDKKFVCSLELFLNLFVGC